MGLLGLDYYFLLILFGFSLLRPIVVSVQRVVVVFKLHKIGILQVSVLSYLRLQINHPQQSTGNVYGITASCDCQARYHVILATGKIRGHTLKSFVFNSVIFPIYSLASAKQ